MKATEKMLKYWYKIEKWVKTNNKRCILFVSGSCYIQANVISFERNLGFVMKAVFRVTLTLDCSTIQNSCRVTPCWWWIVLWIPSVTQKRKIFHEGHGIKSHTRRRRLFYAWVLRVGGFGNNFLQAASAASCFHSKYFYYLLHYVWAKLLNIVHENMCRQC